MKYTHLIWDFNGTVYDDVDAGMVSANRLLCAHGKPPLESIEQYRALFGFPIIDYYRRLGFDFASVPYPQLAEEWVPYYLEAAKDAALYPAFPSVLEEGRRLGVSQVLLSATERTMLQRQVEELGIAACFDEILGLDDIRAYGKEAVGVEWRRRHPNATALMLGDTDHDAAVAAAMGADCILLTCGHQSRAALERCRCLAVMDSAAEAMAYLRNAFEKERL